MRIAILSDIHSNLEALRAAFDVIDGVKPDMTLCLGDIVGYGANPNECVDLVRRRADVVLLGNHDAAAVGTTPIDRFNAHAVRSVHWTREELTEENSEYILSLPLDSFGEGYCAVHASPCEPRDWLYIVDQESANEAFGCFKERVCFIGHTHVPALFREGDVGREPIAEKPVPLDRKQRYIANTGSVGQPRDRDLRFSFGVYDTKKMEFRIVRGEYDVNAAVEKIEKAGLPEMLAKRLLRGT